MTWEYPSIGSIVLFLLGIGFFLFLNAFFVANEFASARVRESQLAEQEDDTKAQAKRRRNALHIVRHLDTYLSANQVGITIASQMQADKFLQPATLLILGLGLVAFIFDTAGGVLFAKLLNLFLKKKINPMIGAAGISAFPMAGRVVHKMALKEDPQNFLLMQATGVNVSGQIASVIAGGMILNFFGN